MVAPPRGHRALLRRLDPGARARARSSRAGRASRYWPVAFSLAFHDALLARDVRPGRDAACRARLLPWRTSSAPSSEACGATDGPRNPFLAHVLLGSLPAGCTRPTTSTRRGPCDVRARAGPAARRAGPRSLRRRQPLERLRLVRRRPRRAAGRTSCARASPGSHGRLPAAQQPSRRAAASSATPLPSTALSAKICSHATGASSTSASRSPRADRDRPLRPPPARRARAPTSKACAPSSARPSTPSPTAPTPSPSTTAPATTRSSRRSGSDARFLARARRRARRRRRRRHVAERARSGAAWSAAVYGADWKLAREYRGAGVARPDAHVGRVSRIFTDPSLRAWRYACVAAMRGAHGDVMRTVRGLHLGKTGRTPPATLAVYFVAPDRLAALPRRRSPASARSRGRRRPELRSRRVPSSRRDSCPRRAARTCACGPPASPGPSCTCPTGHARWLPTWGALPQACGEKLAATRPTPIGLLRRRHAPDHPHLVARRAGRRARRGLHRVRFRSDSARPPRGLAAPRHLGDLNAQCHRRAQGARRPARVEPVLPDAPRRLDDARSSSSRRRSSSSTPSSSSRGRWRRSSAASPGRRCASRCSRTSATSTAQGG